MIEVEKLGRVVLIRLNRPEALNALNRAMMCAIITTMEKFAADPEVGCFVLTGNERAFAAGADIKELAAKGYHEMLAEDYFAPWERLSAIRLPKIAAVAGYALGGGCELAMMCDLIYAAENAQFGQPEIKLGLIPGMGGSQRLARAVGQAKAMDMILTGRMMAAAEAEQAGLVARIFPTETLLEETLAIAQTIAAYGRIALMAGREAVARAQELSLREGLLFERRTYYALWATEDAHEGMAAFIQKRSPQFVGR